MPPPRTDCGECDEVAQPVAESRETRTQLDGSTDSHCVHTEGQLHRELTHTV